MIKHIILTILMFFFSLNLYSDVPNEIITKNPKKEVTTVSSEKNREHANMSITVNKINIVDLIGIERNGYIEFVLPNKVDLKNEMIKAFKTIKTDTKDNKEKTAKLSNENVEIPTRLFHVNETDVVIVEKEKLGEKTYIVQLNKNNNKISKVYRSKNVIQAGPYKPHDRPAGTTSKKDFYFVAFPYWDNSVDLDKTLGGYNRWVGAPGRSQSMEIMHDQYWLYCVWGGYEYGYGHTDGGPLNFYKKGDHLSNEIKVNIRRTAHIRGTVHPYYIKDYTQVLSGPDTSVRNRGDGGYYIESVFRYSHESFNNKLPHWQPPNKPPYIGHNSQDGASDVWFRLECKVNYSEQSNYLKKGGIFEKDMNALTGPLEITDNDHRVYTSHCPWPANVKILLKRNHIEDSINISESDLDSSRKISLHTSQIEEKFGYVNTSDYRYVVNDYGSGIRLDGSGIYIPSSLPTGRYMIEVKWQVTSDSFRTEKDYYDNTGYVNEAGDIIHDGYSDVITINYTSAEEDIGEIKFNIDKRLQLHHSCDWIDQNGGNRRELDHSVEKNYPGFVSVDGNFSYTTNDKITDVISIENRPTKFEVYPGKYVRFTKDSSSVDESAMPYNVNLSNLKQKIQVSMNNSADPKFLDNKFILQGDSGKEFKGNVKENYVGEDAIEGSATLDLTSLDEGERSGWNTPMQSGNISSTDSRTILKVFSGKLFNWKSAVRNDFSHIVTKLKITSEDGTTDIIEGTIMGTLNSTQFPDNEIGIDSNGLYITKTSSKTTETTYKIEAYYGDILLGKLNLKVLNSKEVNIGTVTFNIDKRFDSASSHSWITASGKSFGDHLMSARGDYPEFLEVTGTFDNLDSTNIKKVIGINGYSFKKDVVMGDNSIKYTEFFEHGPNDHRNETAMPYGINLNDIRQHLAVSVNNNPKNSVASNNFKLMGQNGMVYSGNVKEKYVGEDAIEGSAFLNLTPLNVGEVSRWNTPMQSGNIPSTDSRTILKVHAGKLFNWKSAVRNDYSHIVTKLKITSEEGGTTDIIEGTIGGDLSSTQFPNIKIGIDNNGLYIIKTSPKNNVDKYKIEAYYGDVLLGKLDLLVRSDNENIGEVTFNIDKRFYFGSPYSWITASGKSFGDHLTSAGGDYSEFLEVTGHFNDLASEYVEIVEDINGYSSKRDVVMGGNSIHYTEFFEHGPNDHRNETAMPRHMLLRDIERYLVVSVNNNPKNDTADNKFSLVVNSFGMRYIGNVKERFIGEQAGVATATLDMKTGKLKTSGKWSPGISGSNNPSLDTTPYNLNITSGKLFNTRGLHGNYSIVTRLKVKEDGHIYESIGKIKENREVVLKDNAISIDGNTGQLIIKKLTHNHIPKHYEIEAFYGEISLGTLNLTVENGYGFAILDGDEIDFGDFFPGDVKTANTIIDIRNPLHKKIRIKLSDSSVNNMYKRGVDITSQTTIPIKNVEVLELNTNSGEINSFNLSATAVTNATTATGEYEGELEVVITIIP